MSRNPMRYIIFSSGALGGLSLIGAWRALEEKGLTRDIKGLSGCSMGSLIATLASIGYTSNEMELIALNVKYEDYSDASLRSLADNYGVETGKHIVKLIDKLIRFKTGKKGLTFKEHWRLTGRYLWINATHVEQRKCVYYSVLTTPDMKVTDAIRQSISIPFLFAVVRTTEGTFVDGGCYDPVPASVFPKEETLCLNVRNKPISNQSIEGLFAFSSTLLGGMFTELNLLRFKQQELEGYRMIYIYTGVSSFSLSLKHDNITEVILIGRDTCLKHLA
jgi:predicted acylesterase/phospholipase RssA